MHDGTSYVALDQHDSAMRANPTAAAACYYCCRLLLLLPPIAAAASGYMLMGCKKSCKVCDPAKINTGRVIEVPIKQADPAVQKTVATE